MNKNKIQQEVEDFLKIQPEMKLRPVINDEYCLEGTFCFHFSYNSEKICDCYELEILIPIAFPNITPEVKEIGNRIERLCDNHIDTKGKLCLGSPITVQMIIQKGKTLKNFIDNVVVPFLAATTYRSRYGKKLIFGELNHGVTGLVDDYKNLFGLPDKESIRRAIWLLGTKKRIANKSVCPCGCGNKLANCTFHIKINEFRKIAPRKWFKEHLNDFEKMSK